MGGRIEVFKNQNNIYNTNIYLHSAVQTIFSIVSNVSDTAYNISALQMSNFKLRDWAMAVDAYFNGQTVPLMNAIYGYAVEELANIQLSSAEYNRLNGYIVLLQMTHGSTRPDIVLKDQYGKETAWLDITSEGSAGHILNKVGSGWKKTPFVAELLYPVLDLTRIRTDEYESIGSRAHALNIFRQHSMFQNKVESFFYSKFTTAMDVLLPMFENGKLSQSFVAAAIEKTFGVDFPVNYKHPAIKSMLQRYIDDHPYSNTAEFCRYLLTVFYKDTGQNKAAADKFILESYYKFAE